MGVFILQRRLSPSPDTFEKNQKTKLKFDPQHEMYLTADGQIMEACCARDTYSLMHNKSCYLVDPQHPFEVSLEIHPARNGTNRPRFSLIVEDRFMLQRDRCTELKIDLVFVPSTEQARGSSQGPLQLLEQGFPLDPCELTYEIMHPEDRMNTESVVTLDSSSKIVKGSSNSNSGTIAVTSGRMLEFHGRHGKSKKLGFLPYISITNEFAAPVPFDCEMVFT